MNIVAWLDVGLCAGWLSGEFLRRKGNGRTRDIVVGAIGALLGGFLSGVLLGGDVISGANITPVIVAFVSSVILIAGVHMLHRQSRV